MFYAFPQYEPYKVVKYPFASMSMEEADATKLLEISKNLESYVVESVDRFIMGDLSLDKDWDTYLKTLDQIGLGQYVELFDKYYAQYKG